ncbi:PucR family transcriptional regulator [Streptomyces sp. CA-106110]|uniref:PucR family transcriptional regulator n=1 Tax=Streptomyces sp. CA-106110 TaxID=3240044 RepID=UPI003D92A90A
MQVSDLVDMPHLRLTVMAGAAGLTNHIAWAHSSDLDTPWQWMTGGELLLKNGRTLPRAAAKQADFLHRLGDLGASGLVIGMDDHTPPLTPAARQAADQLQLPVVEAPYSVSFTALTRAVADAHSQHEARRTLLTQRIYSAVRHTVTQPTKRNALRELARDFGCRLALVDTETGREALSDNPPSPTDLVGALLTETARHHGTLPGVVHLRGTQHQGVAVEVPYEEPTVLIAFDFHAPVPDTGLLQHAATAAAVLLSHRAVQHEHDRRLGAELLSRLIDARLSDHEAAQELAGHGLTPDRCALIAATGGDEAGERRLHLALTRRDIPHLLLRRDDVLYLALEPSDQTLDLIRRRLGALAPMGLSNPLGTADRAAAARREAAWALRTAAPGQIAIYADVTVLSALLHDPGQTQTIVDRVLGPLLQHEAQHTPGLLHTLETFLACRRSWETTSKALGVHRQTVVYRIRRIEEITGRNLSETADIAELWLALRAKELAAGAD